MGTRNIPISDAGPQVRDVMLVGPETLTAGATVADGRKVFESPRQKLLLLTDGPRFVGAVRREALDGADDGQALDGFVDARAPVMSPEDPTDRVYALVEQHDLNRIPVVGADGELQGLVCFNRTRESFCVA